MLTLMAEIDRSHQDRGRDVDSRIIGMSNLPASWRRALALSALPLLFSACSPNKTSASPGAKAGAQAGASSVVLNPSAVTGKPVGTNVVAGTEIPAEFPKDSIPLPETGLVAAFSNVDGPGKQFNFTYDGPDLTKLVTDAKAKLIKAGFAISGEYDQKVRNVPSAGFVAKSDKWLITVGGQAPDPGKAGLSISVVAL
jgi:hypothetical protein